MIILIKNFKNIICLIIDFNVLKINIINSGIKKSEIK